MTIRIFKVFTILIILFTSAKADYINLIKADKCENIIEIFVEENQIRITFELGKNDYKWFKNIIPIEYYGDGFRAEEKEKSLNKFFMNDFQLIADGRTLKGNIKEAKLIKRILRASLYTGVVDTTNRLSKNVFFVEIIYPIKSRPKQLTLIPPLQTGFETTFANIGFVLYHKKIPVNDLRYLGTTETLNLDWNDPWYTKFENRNIKRHHSNSFMSFLYIDPYEVRHEVLVRIKDLEEWLDFDYKIGDVIPVEDQAKLKNRIAQFLAQHNIVKVDGDLLQPIIDKIHFVEVKLSGIQIQQIPEPLNYSSAIIGVIFAYPNDGIPKEVTVDWDLFSDRIREVPNSATDPAGPMPYLLKPDDNIVTWVNYLKKYKLPTISEATVTSASVKVSYITLILLFPIVFILIKRRKSILSKSKKWKMGIIFSIFISLLFIPFTYNLELPFLQKESFSKPEAALLIDQILKNTYRAFDFRDESDVYDKLEVSIEGELLSDIYIQTKKSMVLENQGGIQVKVDNVKIIDVIEKESSSDGIAYQCVWQVEGTVGHWGHIHRRTNRYDAILDIKPVEGIWKLHALDIIEEARL